MTRRLPPWERSEDELRDRVRELYASGHYEDSPASLLAELDRRVADRERREAVRLARIAILVSIVAIIVTVIDVARAFIWPT